jgi:hypothetical protein
VQSFELIVILLPLRSSARARQVARAALTASLPPDLPAGVLQVVRARPVIHCEGSISNSGFFLDLLVVPGPDARHRSGDLRCMPTT